MVVVYTVQEKVQIIKWFYAGNSAQETINLFIIMFEGRPIPCDQTIRATVRKFEATGCVSKCKRANVPPENNNQDQERRDIMICARAEEDSAVSSRTIARELNISQPTVINVLKKHGYRSFKVGKSQEIFPEDHIRRMVFCEEMLERSNNDDAFIGNILFGDESSFPLHGFHNPSVVRYWSTENKHRSLALRTQYPQKLNIWAGILGDHVVGPFIIDGNLNGDRYLDLLINNVLPAARELPGINMDNVWFQHDGCPAHNLAHDYLQDSFPGRIIGARGTVLWPARSPDLAPNDFFLWGHVKQKIYTHQHQRANNLVELRQKIFDACQSITPVTLMRVRQNFYDRLGYCLAQNGGLFEHLL